MSVYEIEYPDAYYSIEFGLTKLICIKKTEFELTVNYINYDEILKVIYDLDSKSQLNYIIIYAKDNINFSFNIRKENYKKFNEFMVEMTNKVSMHG